MPAAKFARAELDGQHVTVDVAISPAASRRSLPGKVIFVNPLTETGDSYLVRARSRTGNGLLDPGMQVEMTSRKLPEPKRDDHGGLG